MKNTTNIMIVGVGGQGTLLASRILGGAVIKAGHDVKVSEVHGMSQRGGSVVTYVSWGEKVYAPIVDKGEADYILAFEMLEAARYTEFLKPGGKLIANIQQTNPMPVITGAMEYPEDIQGKLRALGVDLDAIDALKTAESAGSAKAVNLVLLGRLAKYFPYPEEDWIECIRTGVPEKFVDMNIKAFKMGKEL